MPRKKRGDGERGSSHIPGYHDKRDDRNRGANRNFIPGSEEPSLMQKEEEGENNQNSGQQKRARTIKPTQSDETGHVSASRTIDVSYRFIENAQAERKSQKSNFPCRGRGGVHVSGKASSEKACVWRSGKLATLQERGRQSAGSRDRIRK